MKRFIYCKKFVFRLFYTYEIPDSFKLGIYFQKLIFNYKNIKTSLGQNNNESI